MEHSDVRRLIGEHDLRPIKGRGQNFLCDSGVTVKMADAADVADGDRVVEVGPGLGILTETLLDRGARVLAIELDPKLARIVRERIASDRLDVLQGDALSFTNAEIASRLRAGEGEYKVVANLPYSVTSAALRKFSSERPRPASFTVMVQREVADRVVAEPPMMSLLSVALRIYGEARRILDVPASAFHPQPKVSSAVLHVRLFSDEEMADRLGGISPETVLNVAKTAFVGRRRQLKNTLSARYAKDVLDRAFGTAGIDPTARPERLSVADWIRLVAELMS